MRQKTALIFSKNYILKQIKSHYSAFETRGVIEVWHAAWGNICTVFTSFFTYTNIFFYTIKSNQDSVLSQFPTPGSIKGLNRKMLEGD